jgi:hypothetical protein
MARFEALSYQPHGGLEENHSKFQWRQPVSGLELLQFRVESQVGFMARFEALSY